MQNVLTVVAGYLGKISLPGLGVIDIIEIGLISFFVYQFMAWIKFTRAYTLLKGILIVLGFILVAYIFKMNTILWIFRNLANVLVIGVIVISLILSISLNSLKKFKTLVKSVYFVPAMIGGVTIALIWDQIYYRVIPVIGKALGISWLSNSVLMSGDTALPAVVFVQIWQAVAMPTVIFIAGLQQIPEEQYESAKIDGATAFQRFRYVTFPYLLPTVTVNLILTIKQGFTSFDFPYALTGGGPVRATEVIGILIYNDAFKNMRFSMANAEACILFVIVAIFSLTQLKLTSKGGTD